MIWISHRGLCENYFENTKASFIAAQAAGFTHFETDLRLTLDNQIALCHDPSLKRVWKSPLQVSLARRPELLKATSSNPLNQIMFLDELFNLFSCESCHWTFDIKPESGSAVLELAIPMIEKNFGRQWLLEKTKFVLWSREDRNTLRRLLPELSDSQIYANLQECLRAAIFCLIGIPAFSGIQKGRTYSLVPTLFGFNLYSKRIVAAYHMRGAKVLAFLPSSEEEAHQAQASQFDELLSNFRPCL